MCLQPVVPVALMWQLRSSWGKYTCAFVYVYRCMLVRLYDRVLVRRCVPRVPACLNMLISVGCVPVCLYVGSIVRPYA